MGEPGALQSAGRWNDLGRRALSASILAPVALLSIWYGAAAFAALTIAASVVLAAEWVALCGARPLATPGIFVTGLVLLASLAAALGEPVAALVGLALVCLLLAPLTGRAVLISGALYIGVPLVALIWLRDGASPVGRGNVLFLVLVVWATDIGAYAVGRLLRGPKLAPALSPGKTWSGAIGGLLAALLVAIAASSSLAGCLVALVLAIASQAGDLLESGIKRHFGVKDTGRLIPGHGGLLDRLDGLLAAALVAALVVLGGRGGQLWL